MGTRGTQSERGENISLAFAHSHQEFTSQGIPELEKITITALSAFSFHYLFSHILSQKPVSISEKKMHAFTLDKHLQGISSKLLLAFVSNQI